MALYIGNTKIASLSQTISPDMVGSGLSVGNDGKLQISVEDIAGDLASAIEGSSGSGDDPLNSLVQAIYAKILTM